MQAFLTMNKTLTACAVVCAMAAVPAHADFPDLPAFSATDELWMARACVHETTWAGGRDTNDCGAMLQTVLLRRAVWEARGERGGASFMDALRRTMPRFTAGTTPRAWTGRLPDGPLGGPIPGWTALQPPRAYTERWSRVRARVHEFMTGVESLPCEQDAWHWFDPGEDGNAIAARMSTGLWEEAECGPVRNLYLYRLDID